MTRFTSDNQQGKNFTFHFETDDKGHFFAIQDLARKCIDNHPIADVVEVVRCKDCAHYIEMEGFCYKGRKARHCVWHSALRGENDYCSDGVRREE